MTVAEKIQDQFDSLKREEDIALVATGNKLAEQTDNTDTLKQLKNIQQAILKALKTTISSFIDLQHCQSFEHYIRRKLTWQYENFLKNERFIINSFLPEPISK